MAQAALGGLDDATVPTRYVFDEGHHLLEAADAAFSVRLSGQEGRELRRWLLGAEAGRSRARGLQRRIGDLVEADEEAGAGADRGAGRRPHPAGRRLASAGRRRARRCPASRAFWRWSGSQVLARAAPATRGYGIEAEARPPIDGLTEAALRLAAGLDRLAAALRRLAGCLRRQLEDAENPPERGACASGSTRRCAASNGAPTCSSAAGARCCAISASRRGPKRSSGWRSTASTARETDVAVNRNWIDPGIPFAAAVAQPAHGIVVTSATLTDGESRAGPRLAGGRGRDRAAPSAAEPGSRRASPRRSTTRRRPASSSSPTSRATISARSPPPSRR